MLLITQLSLAPSNYITPVTVLEPLISNTSILFLNNAFRVHTSQIDRTVRATVPSNTPILCLYRSLSFSSLSSETPKLLFSFLSYTLWLTCASMDTPAVNIHTQIAKLCHLSQSFTIQNYACNSHTPISLAPHHSALCHSLSFPFSHTHALPNSTRAV